MENEKEADRKRLAYIQKREADGHEYASHVDKQIEHVTSRTYSFRAKVATIVSAYDTLDVFGGAAEGRGIGSVLIHVLDACMDNLRRDGLIPLRTSDEVQQRFSEISGEAFRKPNIANIGAPSFGSRPNMRELSEHIAAQIPEQKPDEMDSFETQEFSVGPVPAEKSLEDRIFGRTNDDLIKEASEQNEDGWKEALISCYKTLPENLWDSPTARLLFNANLTKGKNG